MGKIKFNGFQHAILTLQGLTGAEQERILRDISLQDPHLAEQLAKAMVNFEDLKYLTSDMIRNLLTQIPMEVLGLSLRASSEELRQHFMNNLSRNLKKDLEDCLMGPPKRVSEVQKAQEEIMIVVREKIKKGEIVLSKSSSETMV